MIDKLLLAILIEIDAIRHAIKAQGSLSPQQWAELLHKLQPPQQSQPKKK
jgi:hypothetical protein